MPAPNNFEDLLSENQQFLRGLVLSLGVPRQDADDLVQQINIKLLNLRDNFDLNTSFKAWSSSVTRFTCLSYFRDRKRRPHLDISEQALDALQESYIEHYDSIQAKLDTLHLCLSKLSSKDQDLIKNFYIRGESCKELAPALKQSHAAIRKKLSRLRQALRDCLNRQNAHTQR